MKQKLWGWIPLSILKLHIITRRLQIKCHKLAQSVQSGRDLHGASALNALVAGGIYNH